MSGLEANLFLKFFNNVFKFIHSGLFFIPSHLGSNSVLQFSVRKIDKLLLVLLEAKDNS